MTKQHALILKNRMALKQTKKWSVYNFNGRFILTVRQFNNKKIQKNAFQKSYKLIDFK